MREWNFSAGPSVISAEVLKEVQSELLEFKESGMSVMEMSHRSDIFSEISNYAKKDLINLLKVPDDYDVLFLQGGATHQFSMIAFNYKHLSSTADYVTTGSWTKKAFYEATKIFDPNEIFKSDEDICKKVPNIEELRLSKNAAYLHYCPNETIEGVAFHEIPKIDTPLIADMSSVILSEPLEVNKFSIIYAGAQKNMGIPGVTICLVNKDFLIDVDNSSYLNLKKLTTSNSVLNTPPTFSIFVLNLVTEWMIKSGGLDYFEKKSISQSNELYKFLDENSNLFDFSSELRFRSKSNVVFKFKEDKYNDTFIKQANDSGIIGINGHRSIGGIRVSLFNSVDQPMFNYFMDFLKKFINESL